MPITDSAKKALRQSKKRRKRNLHYKSRMKKTIKEITELIEAEKIKKARDLLPEAYKAIDKAAKQNIIHENTAARKKSRLAKKVKKAEEK